MSEESNQAPQVSEEEGTAMQESLMALADEWEQRLRDPAMQVMIREGQVQIDPLVIKLIEMRKAARARDSQAPSQS